MDRTHSHLHTPPPPHPLLNSPHWLAPILRLHSPGVDLGKDAVICVEQPPSTLYNTTPQHFNTGRTILHLAHPSRRHLTAARVSQVLPRDEEAFIAVEQPTLFFLPHCAASMYHNLLASNWAAGRLENVALLGNSLETIAERWQVSRLTPFLTDFDLCESFEELR